MVQGMPTLPEQEVRVLFPNLLPGDVTLRHSHRFPRTVYMLEGTFTLALDGRESFAIEAGQASVEPAGIPMTGFNKGDVPARMAVLRLRTRCAVCRSGARSLKIEASGSKLPFGCLD